MKWQKIDTAPFDTLVLIFYEPLGVGVAEQKDGYWLYDNVGAHLMPKPTRWMPLPTPPEQE